MKCRKCGATIVNEDAAFCWNCGYIIAGTGENPASVQARQASEPDSLPIKGKKPPAVSGSQKKTSSLLKKKKTEKNGKDGTAGQKAPTIQKVNLVLSAVMICLLIHIIVLFAVVQILDRQLPDFTEPAEPETGYQEPVLQQDTQEPSISEKQTSPVHESRPEMFDAFSSEAVQDEAEKDRSPETASMTEESGEIESEAVPAESMPESEPESESVPSEDEMYIDWYFDELDVQPEYVYAASYRESCIVHTNSGNLNIRSGPGMDYDIIGKAPKDSILRIAGYTSVMDDWVLIETEDTVGWVSRDYLLAVEAVS